MFRSIAARSQPLLSHLRRRAAVPSCAYISSSTTPAQGKGSADGTTATATGRHLYVVLQEQGFIMYKLPDVEEDTVTNDQAPLPLPGAALRLSTSLVGSRPHFEALGRKIAIYGYNSVFSERPNVGQLLMLLYDTKTGMLGAGGALQDPDDEVEIKDGYHAATLVKGDKLCVLETDCNKPVYLYEDMASCYYDDCNWEQGSSPLPPNATGKCDIKSHALHPDGHTIFASSSFTFSLDTESQESLRRGNWHLPFHGWAHYDGELKAWVGVRVADGTEGGTIKGRPYLCVCNVPKALPREPGQRTTVREPAWKICKQELTFVKRPARARAALVHVGRGKFCLVETSEGVEHLIHVTVFHAKRGKNRELKVTPCQPTRSYILPKYADFCNAILM